MVPSIFLLLSLPFLGYSAVYDYKNHEVQAWVLIVLLVLGISNCIYLNADIVNVVVSVVLFGSIFGVLALIGRSWGDFFLFLLFGLFIIGKNSIFVFCWWFLLFGFLLTCYFIVKERVFSWVGLRKFEFPLVPVIFFSFCFWCIWLLF